MGSDGSHGMGGPYEPRISPDGKRFSYYFYVQPSFDDLEHSIRWIDTGSYGTWTWADHFTSPATESEYLRGYTQAEWVTDDRLLGTAGMFLNMWTWKLGTGHGYTYQAGQWWFGLQDPVDEWGVEGYHWYNDPALSRDGSKLAMTDGGGGDSQLLIADDRLPYAARRVLQPELVREQRHAGLRHVRRRAPHRLGLLAGPPARPRRSRPCVRAGRRQPGAGAACGLGAHAQQRHPHRQALAQAARLPGRRSRYQGPLHAVGGPKRHGHGHDGQGQARQGRQADERQGRRQHAALPRAARFQAAQARHLPAGPHARGQHRRERPVQAPALTRLATSSASSSPASRPSAGGSIGSGWTVWW